MAKIITICNQKGGVGKTTSTINISACLTRIGNNVLTVDLDPQGNLSKSWGIENQEKNIYSLLLGESKIGDTIIPLKKKLTLNSSNDHIFDIIPSTSNFARYEKIRVGEVNSQFDLKKVLKQASLKYDYILLDCPPSLGLITVNAFFASKYVLVPMEAHLFAMDGLDGIHNSIKQLKEFSNSDLKIAGIFFVRHARRKILSREVEKFISKEYPGLLLNTIIRENIALREAPHEEKDIFSYEPESNGAKDYKNLTIEILNRL